MKRPLAVSEVDFSDLGMTVHSLVEESGQRAENACFLRTGFPSEVAHILPVGAAIGISNHTSAIRLKSEAR